MAIAFFIISGKVEDAFKYSKKISKTICLILSRICNFCFYLILFDWVGDIYVYCFLDEINTEFYFNGFGINVEDGQLSVIECTNPVAKLIKADDYTLWTENLTKLLLIIKKTFSSGLLMTLKERDKEKKIKGSLIKRFFEEIFEVIY